MLRLLSAIGMSRYTGQQSLDRYISEQLMSSHMRAQHFVKDGHLYVELFKEMGPFQLIMRGVLEPDQYIRIGMVCPAIKEKRGYELIECEVHEEANADLFMFGQERGTLEGLCLRLTEVHRFYKEQGLMALERTSASCYGLSFEGKVLLGLDRSEDDLAAMEDVEARRRGLLRRAMEGDEGAIAQIQEDDEMTEQEIEDRLQQEDVYSIFDGFLYPAEGAMDNYYTVLGDIVYVTKLMNSETEEWVYYLELNVLGMLLRVSINPIDLLGEPLVGCRFMGRVALFGRLNPARQMLEDPRGFY